MKYLIEMRIGCEVKDTYEEAEIFCYEHGIHPEEIVEMLRLYPKLGTYAAVGREVGRSAETVARYVKMKNVPQNIRLAAENLSRIDSMRGINNENRK